jgi:hypothetical protein
MYNLANRTKIRDASGNIVTIPGAPVPIPGGKVGLEEFDLLNQGNLDFTNRMTAGTEFFFKAADGSVDRDPSITSYLCTDDAFEIFEKGSRKLDGLALQAPRYPYTDPPPDDPNRALTNDECLTEAIKFYQYVDVEGYRGSPHKL